MNDFFLFFRQGDLSRAALINKKLLKVDLY